MASRQSAEALKLERLQQLKDRLTQDYQRERIPVSEASKALIEFTQKNPDPLIHSATVETDANPFIKSASRKCTLL